MAPKQKLAHPAFVIAVLILALNDWYLKPVYANSLTGKLSDIAGLFALPFFFSVFIPRNKVWVYVFTFLAFVIWKSPLVQPLLDYLNSLGLPVRRVVDYSDYLALFILPLSFYILNKAEGAFLKPALLNLLAVVALLAFAATTVVPPNMQWYTTNNTYPFPFSKRELVSRINALQLEYVHDIDRSAHYDDKGVIKNKGVTFNSKNNTFYYSSTYNGKVSVDTIARILDYQVLTETDTIRLRTSHADIIILGDTLNSQLKVIAIRGYASKSKKPTKQKKALVYLKNTL